MSEFFNQIWRIIVESNLLNISGAILILLVGYLTALVLGKKSTRWMEKLFSKFVMPYNSNAVFPITRTAGFFGRVIYGLIMLLAVLGCLSVLKMDAAAAPLQDFIGRITAYMPNIAGALLLLFMAWIILEVVKMFCMAFLQTIRISERFPLNKNEKSGSEKFVMYVSKTAGYIVYLFFLPAILNALKIYGITRPLQSMFEEFLVFVPNLIGAVVILLIGLWAASLARKAVRGLTIISKVDELGDKLSADAKVSGTSLAAMIGWLVYVLIALPVVIAALDALDIDVLSRAAAGFFRKVLDVSGEIAISGAIFMAVYCGGKFVAAIIERLTAAWGLDNISKELCCCGDTAHTVKISAVAGKIAYIALYVVAAIAVCDILDLPKLSSLIKRFAVFGGNLILSSIVLIIGVRIANIAARMVAGKLNQTIVYALKAAVMIFTFALAVSNLQLGGSVVETAFALILGAFAVAGAIAFGVGGRAVAAKLLEEWLEKMKK